MKHLYGNTAALTSELIELLGEVGVLIPSDIAERLVAHLVLVLESNSRVRLTAINDPREGLRLHIADSLTVLEELGEVEGVCVDLGSGAGYPGIPLALVTGREFVLLEAVRKKAEFLEEAVAATGISGTVRVERLRAEELATVRPGGFGVVIARAVAELPSLVELAAPLLRQGGVLVSMKGAPTAAELERGDSVGELLGLRQRSRRELELPGLGEKRSILVYEKISESSRNLPRRTGMAQRKPLA